MRERRNTICYTGNSEGKRKEVKRNTSIFSEMEQARSGLVIGDFRSIEEEKVLRGHDREWNRELIKGE